MFGHSLSENSTVRAPHSAPFCPNGQSEWQLDSSIDIRDVSMSIRPQPSERWAMYTLICPLVDRANAISGFASYYEYSRPNGPNRRLSADIALIENDKVVWLIEAKKFSRVLSPELIDAYLTDGTMGVVTNGNHWIFIAGDQKCTVGPIVDASGTIEEERAALIVALLQTRSIVEATRIQAGWSNTWQKIPRVKTPMMWELSAGLGSRSFYEKVKCLSLSEAASQALRHVYSDSPTEHFFKRLLERSFSIATGTIEVSEKRLIWWITPSTRGARINLESSMLEILVLSSLLDALGRHNVFASQKIHDKNLAMTVCKATKPHEIDSLIPLFGVALPDSLKPEPSIPEPLAQA
jgi:hypothetical protein